MKKLLQIKFLLIFLLTLTVSCGKKDETSSSDTVPILTKNDAIENAQKDITPQNAGQQLDKLLNEIDKETPQNKAD